MKESTRAILAEVHDLLLERSSKLSEAAKDPDPVVAAVVENVRTTIVLDSSQQIFDLVVDEPSWS